MKANTKKINSDTEKSQFLCQTWYIKNHCSPSAKIRNKYIAQKSEEILSKDRELNGWGFMWIQSTRRLYWSHPFWIEWELSYLTHLEKPKEKVSSAGSSRSFIRHKSHAKLEQIMKKVPKEKVNDIHIQLSIDPSYLLYKYRSKIPDQTTFEYKGKSEWKNRGNGWKDFAFLWGLSLFIKLFV